MAFFPARFSSRYDEPSVVKVVEYSIAQSRREGVKGRPEVEPACASVADASIGPGVAFLNGSLWAVHCDRD